MCLDTLVKLALDCQDEQRCMCTYIPKGLWEEPSASPQVFFVAVATSWSSTHGRVFMKNIFYIQGLCFFMKKYLLNVSYSKIR